MFTKNKKGNWLDIFYFIIGAIGLSTIVILMFIFNSNINTSFHNNTIIANDPNAMTTHDNFISSYPSIFDWILPFIYLCFIGITIWSASIIPSSNKFFFIGLLLSIIIVFFSLVIEEFWHQFVTHQYIASYVSSFPITNFFMEQMRYFALFFCFIVIIMLYTRAERSY